MPEAAFPFTFVTSSSAYPIIHLSGLNAAPNTPLPWAYDSKDGNKISYIDYQYLLGMPFWSVASLANITTTVGASYRNRHGFKFKSNVSTVYITTRKEYYTLTNLALSGTPPGGLAASGWTYSNPINALSASLELEPGYILKVDDYQCGDKKYRGGSKSIIFEKSPDGKIGIGTTDPTTTLTVSGDTTIFGGLTALSAVFDSLHVKGTVIGGGASGDFLPLSGGTLTGPLSAKESVEIYDIDAIKFIGEQKIVESSTSTITATNEYLKIEVNGNIRYLRLFDLQKRPEMLSMVWDTNQLQSGDTDNTTIVLPICSSSFAPSGINIDWGDGSIETRTTPTLTGISHTYTTPGIYAVTVIDNQIL